MERLFPRLTLAVLLFVPLGGCYEIPPRVPRGYVGSEAEPGWPPPAVYDADPFHPANRLFQRLFVLGPDGAVGAPGSGDADVPFPARRELGAVGRAEAVALLNTLNQGAPGSSFPADPAARALFASDLLWLSARAEALRAAGSIEHGIPPLSRAALVVAAEDAPPASPLPPPLREPGWTEVEQPLAAGLRPSLADLRWSRVFRRERGGVEMALLRLRITVGPDHRPILLPLGSEAWFFGPGEEGRPAGRVFQFRRARLIRGEDPWEDVGSEREIAVLDPRDPGKAPLTGKVDALLPGCQSGLAGGSTPPADSTLPGGPDRSAEIQTADARRALEALFSSGS